MHVKLEADLDKWHCVTEYNSELVLIEIVIA